MPGVHTPSDDLAGGIDAALGFPGEVSFDPIEHKATEVGTGRRVHDSRKSLVLKVFQIAQPGGIKHAKPLLCD
jgi:hypothetical protein